MLLKTNFSKVLLIFLFLKVNCNNEQSRISQNTLPVSFLYAITNSLDLSPSVTRECTLIVRI